MKVQCTHDGLVPISSLLFHPKNTNKHPKEQIERLAKILEYQGWRYPVKVSKLSGYVTSGHGRVLAAMHLGWTEVPVNFQEYDNETQELADLTSDNAIASWAELDLSMVNLQLGDMGPDFDIDLLGIKNFTIDVAEKAGEDDVPTNVEPRTKPGDVYQLGNHRLMCGDSTSIDAVNQLMNGQKVDMIFTDPPYNVAFNGRSGKHEVIKNDNLDEASFAEFISDVMQTIQVIDAPVYYIWCNWSFYSVLHQQLPYKACIVWAKNVFGMGSGYRHQHEFCLFNGKIDEHIKNESDLWEVKKDVNYVHPTQKPVELSKRALGNHSQAKNILDLFGGSGSTMIGCEEIGRNCFMMELDPKYCDVIVARWEKYTGKKAELINGTA